ncbi:MAG: hypothetical protein AAF727_17590 [Pseudomonadota bacterium]
MDQIAPDELKTRIHDEITSHALRTAILETTDPAPPPKIDWLRHPLLLTTVGFLFTGIVGTWLEMQMADSAKAAAKREAALQHANQTEARARVALLDLMQITNERAIRTSLLRSALETKLDQLPEGLLMERKTAYDQTFVEWNVELDSVLFRIREALAEEPDAVTTPHRFEALMDAHVSTGPLAAFRNADMCLTDAFVKLNRPGGRVNGFICGNDWKDDVISHTQRATACVEAILSEGILIARYNNEKTVAVASGDAVLPELLADDALPEEACKYTR